MVILDFFRSFCDWLFFGCFSLLSVYSFASEPSRSFDLIPYVTLSCFARSSKQMATSDLNHLGFQRAGQRGGKRAGSME